MRMALLFLLLLLGTACPARAQAEGLAKAQEEFNKGHYAQAAVLYQEMLNGSADARLHYNLALAHQYLNHKGEARAHYERAHQLSPWDWDINHNLARLRSTLDDSEPDTPAWQELALLFSGTGLYVIFCLAHLGLWWGAWRYHRGRRELHLWTTVMCLFVAIACLGLLAIRSHRLLQAAVAPASVVLKNGPGREFTDSLQLHAGTLVEVLRREGDWTEVEALGNVRAWIPESDLVRVNLPTPDRTQE